MRSSPLFHPAISAVSASLRSMLIGADHTTNTVPVANGKDSILLGNRLAVKQSVWWGPIPIESNTFAT